MSTPIQIAAAAGALIEATDLALAKATSLSVMIDMAQVQLRTDVSDGAGGFITTWVDGDLVPCLLTPAPGGAVEGAIMGRLTTHTMTQIKVPVTTQVTARDRLVVNGITYEVKTPLDHGSLAVLMVLLCVRVL